MFKLFGALDTIRPANTEGIGLGLVISKMITEQFGGFIRMRSRHLTGSLFQSSFII